MSKKSVYQIVTDQIIEMLDNGVVPWHKPWKGTMYPSNLISKKAYRGINPFILACVASMKGYDSPFWLTYNQAKKKGGQVRKGEKSTLVVFWKWIEKEVENDNGEMKKRSFPILRYYNVFNLDQIDGIESPEAKEMNEDFNSIECAENIIHNMPNKPQIYHNGTRAFYRPSEDMVTLPKKERFENEEEYYSTAFHELGHSTGHESRLKRDLSGFFGDEKYSQEELVAEMTAAFLCGVCEIENVTIENSAAYIAGWKKKLKEDEKIIVRAAAQAQKAADFILNENNEAEAEEEAA